MNDPPLFYKNTKIQNPMIKTQQYSLLLQKLFNPEDQSLHIDLSVLKQICQSQDYHCLIELTSILTRLFLAGKQKLSMRQLIGTTVVNQNRQKQDKMQFFIDALSANQLSQLIKQLLVVRKKLKYTVYSSRLHSVINLIRKVLDQVKPGNDKKGQDGSLVVGDFQLIEEQVKKLSVNCPLLVGSNLAESKIADFMKNPKNYIDGKLPNFITLQKYTSKQIFPLLQRNILTIPLGNHTQRQNQLSRVLKFIKDFYLPQYKLQVQISKNTLVQNRIYVHKLYRQFLSKYYSQMLKTIATIVNQSILCPSSIHIQLTLLRILRRIYLLGEEGISQSSQNIQNIRTNPVFVASSPATYVRNPLFLVLRNISLFSQGHDDELKEAAMLSYKIVNDKNDLELAAMIQNNDDIRFLRNSKFYTSKAYIYSEQIQRTYEPSELAGLYLKLHRSVAARQIWTYTVLVEKPSSLFCWQFYIGGYDIKFGIFKIDELRQMAMEEYEQGSGCRQVHKMQKIQNTSSNPLKGHIFLKNGLYRVVFDNSFSLMRSKELYYSFLHLQSSS